MNNSYAYVTLIAFILSGIYLFRQELKDLRYLRTDRKHIATTLIIIVTLILPLGLALHFYFIPQMDAIMVRDGKDFTQAELTLIRLTFKIMYISLALPIPKTLLFSVKNKTKDIESPLSLSNSKRAN